MSHKNGSERCSFERKGEKRKNGKKERKHLQFIVVPVDNPSTWTSEAGELQ